MKKLHLVTQRDQPYGSRRKCCERCGKSIYAMSSYDEGYVDTEDDYSNPEDGWTKCADAPKHDIY